MQNEADEESTGFDGPSKTRVKKAMLELQELGVALLDLTDAQLDAIEMDNPLRAALRELRRLRDRSARKRQIQFVGKLLRQADPEPFRRAIAAHRLDRSLDTRALHEVERWRDRLIADDTELTAWINLYPVEDLQVFRTLIRNARRDLAASQKAEPHRGAAQVKGRAYRELFQKVRTAMQAVKVRTISS